jgi:hypothetical protein
VKKLLVYLDDVVHEDLKTLALQKKTTMAGLVRYAVSVTYEDELDAVAAERELRYAAEHPETTMSWEEFKRLRQSTMSEQASARKVRLAEQRKLRRPRAAISGGD